MQDRDFQFKKSLGQNFLQDEAILSKIVTSACLKEHSLVIEIGPGSGNLTKKISRSCEQVLAYEIDSRLESVLKDRLKECSNVSIIYDDFLTRNVLEDLKPFSYEHLFIIANLPYYITTPIITKVVEDQIPVDGMLLMMQKEVGDRMTAQPGCKEYSSLSVFLQYYFYIKKEFVVSRNAFIPRPNVDSVVLKFERKKDLLPVKSMKLFQKLVRDSFQFKRKTLRNNLKGYDLEKIEETLKKYHYDLTVRAEQLSLEILVEISNTLFEK